MPNETKITEIGTLYELKLEVDALRRENTRLRLLIAVLKQPFSNCKRCHKLLRTLDWNTQTFILVCNNDTCKDYRTPVITINKEVLKDV